jgi:hypothetical protein
LLNGEHDGEAMLKGIFTAIAVVIGGIIVLAQMSHDVRSLASILGISGSDVHSVAERVGISDTSAPKSSNAPRCRP